MKLETPRKTKKMVKKGNITIAQFFSCGKQYLHGYENVKATDWFLAFGVIIDKA